MIVDSLLLDEIVCGFNRNVSTVVLLGWIRCEMYTIKYFERVFRIGSAEFIHLYVD